MQPLNCAEEASGAHKARRAQTHQVFLQNKDEEESPSDPLRTNFPLENLVRKEGFEPPRPFGHKILSLARLPVPPLPQW
jgi:hypothetical protein